MTDIDIQSFASMPMITGTCDGCGAPWSVHPAANALAPGANECSYCKRPRYSASVLALAAERSSPANAYGYPTYASRLDFLFGRPA